MLKLKKIFQIPFVYTLSFNVKTYPFSNEKEKIQIAIVFAKLSVRLKQLCADIKTKQKQRCHSFLSCYIVCFSRAVSL